MSTRFPVDRKNMQFLFREARKLGPYSEFPLLNAEVDPQLHLSRNDRDQPFWLICEKDCTIGQLSGRASIEFRDASVNRFGLTAGDFVYIPGGIPHRLRIFEESVQVRYKARNAGREAVTWFCEHCGSRLAHALWDTGAKLAQAQYLAACVAFNGDGRQRTCSTCGTSHALIDLTPYQWSAISVALAGEPSAPAAATATV